MQIDIAPATVDDRPLLEAMFYLYQYDFSEFTGEDLDDRGRYEAPEYLDRYFSEPERHPFIVRADGPPAGFALVRRCEAGDGSGEVIDMAEFFIMRKYRRGGAGERAATWLFDRFPGRWQVRELANNLPAQAFWRAIIGRYTGGRFEDIDSSKGPVQYFTSPRHD